MANECVEPNIVVIGLHGRSELDIIKGILDDDLPLAETCNNFEKYKWFIKNKYYEAEVYLSKIINKKPASLDLQFSEAIIIYMDNSKLTALQDLDEVCSSLIQDIDVRLLVCDCFNNENNHLSKLEVQEWCITHGWELVELQPDSEDVNSDEDDDGEGCLDSYGFTRIRQALHAHTWSNLRLNADKSVDGLPKVKSLTSSTIDEESLEKLNLSDIEDDFTALFSSLGMMKAKADSLPPDMRKKYAEEIAISFLMSFGDEEEL